MTRSAGFVFVIVVLALAWALLQVKSCILEEARIQSDFYHNLEKSR